MAFVTSFEVTGRFEHRPGHFLRGLWLVIEDAEPGNVKKIETTYGGQAQNFCRWKISGEGINGRLYIRKGSELTAVRIELRRIKRKAKEDSEENRVLKEDDF